MLGDDHDVLEAHAAEALAVEPRLDGQDVAGAQLLVPSSSEARILVHREADTVAEPVDVAGDGRGVDAGGAARGRVARPLEEPADERVDRAARTPGRIAAIAGSSACSTVACSSTSSAGGSPTQNVRVMSPW